MKSKAKSVALAAPLDLADLYVEATTTGRTPVVTDMRDPDDLLSSFEAHLILVGETDCEQQVGVATGRFLNVGAAINAGESLTNILDCDGDEELGYGSAVFDTGGWRRIVEDACESWPSNLLIIKRMELDDVLRGRKVGLAFLKGVLASSNVPSGTVVVIKPYALGHKTQTAAQRAGTAKLAAYWQQAGFSRIGRSAYYMYYCP